MHSQKHCPETSTCVQGCLGDASSHSYHDCKPADSPKQICDSARHLLLRRAHRMRSSEMQVALAGSIAGKRPGVPCEQITETPSSGRRPCCSHVRGSLVPAPRDITGYMFDVNSTTTQSHLLGCPHEDDSGGPLSAGELPASPSLTGQSCKSLAGCDASLSEGLVSKILRCWSKLRRHPGPHFESAAPLIARRS